MPNRLADSRYLHKGIDLLPFHAPDLRVLEKAKSAGLSHVNLDGVVIPTDRVKTPGPNGADLWWSGKHKHHGRNVQVISAPTGGHCGPRRYGPAANTT